MLGRRSIVVAIVATLGVAGGGGAYAATHGGSPARPARVRTPATRPLSSVPRIVAPAHHHCHISMMDTAADSV